jgi:hypothetical protein
MGYYSVYTSVYRGPANILTKTYVNQLLTRSTFGLRIADGRNEEQLASILRIAVERTNMNKSKYNKKRAPWYYQKIKC